MTGGEAGHIATTARLTLRRAVAEDAAFILELVNDPDWLRNIGDRNVHSLEDAVRYLENGAIRSYAENGFGLYVMTLRDDGAAIGLCGLVSRPTLEDVDIGFALLPGWRGQGYASEAVAAVLVHARTDLGRTRLLAIVNPANRPSIALLERHGFNGDELRTLVAGDAPVRVLSRTL